MHAMEFAAVRGLADGFRSGGLYASFADLRKLGLSILHSELLDSTTTRAWMKPHGFVAPLTVGLGAPWEINRLPLAVSPGSNRTRISDLYSELWLV